MRRSRLALVPVIALLGALPLAGCGSDGSKSGAQPSKPSTTSITNIAGDEIKVKLKDGKPFTDWNEDDINDFDQDLGDNGTPDGYEYTEVGLYAGPAPEDHSKDPLEELPINNSLTEDQVNEVLAVTNLVDWHRNAFYEIRNFDEDRAQAFWKVYEKYKDRLSENLLTVDLMVLWEDDWKETLYDGPGQ